VAGCGKLKKLLKWTLRIIAVPVVLVLGWCIYGIISEWGRAPHAAKVGHINIQYLTKTEAEAVLAKWWQGGKRVSLHITVDTQRSPSYETTLEKMGADLDVKRSVSQIDFSATGFFRSVGESFTQDYEHVPMVFRRSIFTGPGFRAFLAKALPAAKRIDEQRAIYDLPGALKSDGSWTLHSL